MKKKSILLGVFLSVVFGCFALFYSSKSAAIKMLMFAIFSSVIIVIIEPIDWYEVINYRINFSSMHYLLFSIINVFTILWNVHIIKKQNEAIDKNGSYSSDFAVNDAKDIILPTMACLFFTFGIIALIVLFTKQNNLLKDWSSFYFILITITVIFSILPKKSINS